MSLWLTCYTNYHDPFWVSLAVPPVKLTDLKLSVKYIKAYILLQKLGVSVFAHPKSFAHHPSQELWKGGHHWLAGTMVAARALNLYNYYLGKWLEKSYMCNTRLVVWLINARQSWPIRSLDACSPWCRPCATSWHFSDTWLLHKISWSYCAVQAKFAS